jgi:sugar phosphate isomerase/epimerase
MALNVLFRSAIEIDAVGALPEVEAEAEVELVLLELQAAMSSAALTPAATTPAFLREDTNIYLAYWPWHAWVPCMPRDRIRTSWSFITS